MLTQPLLFSELKTQCQTLIDQTQSQEAKSLMQDLEHLEAVESLIKRAGSNWFSAEEMRDAFIALAQAVDVATKCHPGPSQFSALFTIQHTLLLLAAKAEMSQAMRYEGIAHWISEVDDYISNLDQFIAEINSYFRSLNSVWWEKFEAKLTNSPVGVLREWNPWGIDAITWGKSNNTQQKRADDGWRALTTNLRNPLAFLSDLEQSQTPDEEAAAIVVFSLTNLVCAANVVRRNLDVLWDLEAEHATDQMKPRYHPESLRVLFDDRSIPSMEQEFANMLQMSEKFQNAAFQVMLHQSNSGPFRGDEFFYEWVFMQHEKIRQKLRLDLSDMKNKHALLMQSVNATLKEARETALPSWWQGWVHPQAEIEAFTIASYIGRLTRFNYWDYYYPLFPIIIFLGDGMPSLNAQDILNRQITGIYSEDRYPDKKIPPQFAQDLVYDYNPKAPPKELIKGNKSYIISFHANANQMTSWTSSYAPLCIRLRATVGAASLALQELQRLDEEKKRLLADGITSPVETILATVDSLNTALKEISSTTDSYPEQSGTGIPHNLGGFLWVPTTVEESPKLETYGGDVFLKRPWIWCEYKDSKEFLTQSPQASYGLSLARLRLQFDELIIAADVSNRESLELFMKDAQTRIRVPVLNPTILTSYGEERKPIGNTPEYPFELTGIDVQMPIGLFATAVMSGRVIRTYTSKDKVSMVIINHGLDLEDNTLCSLYLYISDLQVKAGDLVELGQPIGSAGVEDEEGRGYIYYELRLVPPGGDMPECAQFFFGSPGNSLDPQDYIWPAARVSSIVRADPNPTSVASVNFIVTFSDSVTGVDVNDFALTARGIKGASIIGVSGSGKIYTVTVNTGNGDGTLRLDLIDNDSIVDVYGNHLGGMGAGNGDFTGGEIYDVSSKFFLGRSATLVLGQPDFTSTVPSSSPTGMDHPFSIAVDPTTGKVFIGDIQNNRILRFASGSSLVNGAAAEAVLGQPSFTSKFTVATQSGICYPYGIFVDSAGRLWVADSLNHRIIRFDHASSKPDGANADGVLGQQDFSSNSFATTQNRMSYPMSVFVDYEERLWVADQGNHRILRFDNAASLPNGANANGVLGQVDFTSADQATTQNGMNSPQSVFVDLRGCLWVLDLYARRILRFDNASSKTNGANADGVLGQPDFITRKFEGLTQSRMGGPTAVTGDNAGRLYVSETYHRVLIFDDAAFLPNGAKATNVLGQKDFITWTMNAGGLSAATLNNPAQIFYDSATEVLWVADKGNDRVLRYGTPVTPPLPVVASITRASANPTIAPTVDFTVTFTTNVRGVDVSSFALITKDITGASIREVSGRGKVYKVTVNTGYGDGTLRLDVVDDDSIVNSALMPLGRLGAGNGDFTTGEIYTTSIWKLTGSLNGGRTKHTTTLLPNGKILIVGGEGASTAELYDPDKCTWSTTGSLAQGRYYHTAILLPTGKVLVTGGSARGLDTNYYFSSAELYDPDKGTWEATNPLKQARFCHTATLLPNGKVLVVGGYGNGTYLTSAEIYDPDTGLWASTDGMFEPRYQHTATLLLTGNVLVAGGQNNRRSLASSELYNPLSGTWKTTGAMPSDRYEFHTATLLPNGKVLVVGGYGRRRALKTTILYDPNVGLWKRTGALKQGRVNHATTLLWGGKVLVTGGFNSTCLASAEVYDPAAGVWNRIDDMPTPRHYHSAILLPNNQVLLAGGLGKNDYVIATELYGVPSLQIPGTIQVSESYQPSVSTNPIEQPLVPAHKRLMQTLFNSLGGYDGWVLESSEMSSVGGEVNISKATFKVGDDAANKQYMGILHFDISSLPKGAIVVSAILKIKQQGGMGRNPFNSHGDLVVDIGKPYFGMDSNVENDDFQALPLQSVVGTFNPVPIERWYDAKLSDSIYSHLNLGGITQFRLRFTRGDNNDLDRDYMRFYSGNAKAVKNHPQLIIQYYIP